MAKRTLRTRLCDELGIDYPILSAGMGPSLVGEETGAPVALVVAVSEAGGLGVLGGAGYSVEQLRDKIGEIRKLTDKPFGVDLLLPAQQVRAGDQPSGGSDIPLNDALAALPAFGSAAEGCAEVPGVEARADCWIDPAATFAARMRVIEDGVEADPETALAALARVESDRSRAPRVEQGEADFILAGVCEAFDGGDATICDRNAVAE